MTDFRKQVLIAATSKAAFKPRSDIEGLGRKLRAIMRKGDAPNSSSIIVSASPMSCFAYPPKRSGLRIR
jgi:hypothetical protein